MKNKTSNHHLLHLPKYPLLWMAVLSMFITVMVAGCGGGNAEDQPVSSDQEPAGALSGASTQVVGKVTDKAGKPIAEVGIAVKEGTGPVPEMLALTDEEGKYTWSLSAGKYKLAAIKEGYAELVQEVEVKEGEKVELNFQLEAAP